VEHQIITLEQKNRKLQTQINGLKVKLLKFETKSLKQEQKIIKLQAKYDKLKEEKFKPMVTFANDTHDKPPKD